MVNQWAHGCWRGLVEERWTDFVLSIDSGCSTDDAVSAAARRCEMAQHWPVSTGFCDSGAMADVQLGALAGNESRPADCGMAFRRSTMDLESADEKPQQHHSMDRNSSLRNLLLASHVSGQARTSSDFRVW